MKVKSLIATILLLSIVLMSTTGTAFASIKDNNTIIEIGGGGTSTPTTYTVTITINTGIQSIAVTKSGTTTTYTSSSTLSVTSGTSISYVVTAKPGYTASVTSGSKTVSANYTIAPTATVKTFTLKATYSPSNATSVNLGWSIAWVSGKSLSGNASDYVSMTVASDGMSVTLKFVKDFSAGQIVVTCYSKDDTSVKSTCILTCGS